MHRNVRYIRTPDLIRLVNDHVFEKIRIHLVFWMFLAGVGCLIDRNQPHQAHQTPNTVTTTGMPLRLHPAGHLARAIPGCLQKLLVDDFHELQVFRALALWRVVKIGARQAQQFALAAHV